MNGQTKQTVLVGRSRSVLSMFDAGGLYDQVTLYRRFQETLC
jgi:hypothetical protein